MTSGEISTAEALDGKAVIVPAQGAASAVRSHCSPPPKAPR
jgi:hypothetical protein